MTEDEKIRPTKHKLSLTAKLFFVFSWIWLYCFYILHVFDENLENA